MEYFHGKGEDLGIILANVLKCEKNWRPTADQFVIQCPSYGIDDCSKNFCVSKKWCNLRPLNSDGSCDVQNIHWGHQFKRLHEEDKIANNTLNMEDNHLCYLLWNNLLRDGSRIFPYFDFDNMNFVKYRIKGIARKKMENIEVKIKEVMAENRNGLDAEKSKRADMSIRIANV